MTIDEATILVTGATDGRGRRVVHGRAAQGAAVLLRGRAHKRIATRAHDHAARARLQALTERLCCLVGGRPLAAHDAQAGGATRTSPAARAPAPPAASATEGAVPPVDPRRWAALAVAFVGTFMALLDVFIVLVAAPAIQRGLHATTGEIQFVLAGYQLTYAVTLVTGGRLGDLHGRKRLFMWGLAFWLFLPNAPKR